MPGRNWSFVKKTFRTLNIAKATSITTDADDCLNPSEANSDRKSQSSLSDKEPPATKKKRVKKKQGSKKDLRTKSERLTEATERREDVMNKKRLTGDEFICRALGMDESGMCLRHPNQPITVLSHSYEEVQMCRICDSENQVVGKAPRQRKSMAVVIGQVKQMQANRKDWRQRTRVMFWGSQQKLDFDSSDDDALVDEMAITEQEWEAQVTKRVTQVSEWQTSNQLQEHPVFSRYFKMVTMGIPLEAAKNACDMDGNDGRVLDLDPTKSLKAQLGDFDESSRQSLLTVDDSNPHEDGEEVLEVPEMVDRVRTSFSKRKSEQMVEAVQIVDRIEKKVNKQMDENLSEPNNGERGRKQEKEHRKEGRRGTKKKKKLSSRVRSPHKRRSSGPEGANTKASRKKKKKNKKKLERVMPPIIEGSEGMDEEDLRAKIDSLNIVLLQKNSQIAILKDQIRQKDSFIQTFSKRRIASSKGQTPEESPQMAPVGGLQETEIGPGPSNVDEDKEIMASLDGLPSDDSEDEGEEMMLTDDEEINDDDEKKEVENVIVDGTTSSSETSEYERLPDTQGHGEGVRSSQIHDCEERLKKIAHENVCEGRYRDEDEGRTHDLDGEPDEVDDDDLESQEPQLTIGMTDTKKEDEDLLA